MGLFCGRAARQCRAMMEIRPATPRDAHALAELHVAAWAEAYAGLLPEEEIARHDLGLRKRQWTRQLATRLSRTVIAPGAGFAQVGPQREEDRLTRPYPEELYALYVLEAHHGTGVGRALLKAALGPEARPFTALVVEGNARACAFYEKVGGVLLDTRAEAVGKTSIRERVYGWASPDRI